MHWSEKIAKEIIRRSPDKEEYVCAAGISPSGSIHIGNFRDIVTSYFVCLALRRQGKKARLLFSWDEFDRLRKVPVNVQKITEGFEKYIGMPYASIPDPYGCCSSYAEHFEKEFEASLAAFGIEVDFRRQAEMYRSGAYKDEIIYALKHRDEIFDILDSFRTQDSTAEEKANYYPVGIYCSKCGKDTTKITSLSEDCTKAHYTCQCGHEADFDFETEFDAKLAWKIDWPMRWKFEQVDFEPGGKDHASPTGSYQTSRVISEKIFNFPAPYFQGYEFIGIKGTTGKMSGSSGLNLTPKTLLKLYQPEVILWLYSKTEPLHAFDFCFDDEILRQYFEFDKMYNAVKSETADDRAKEIIANAIVEGHEVITVPMAQLVSLGSVVDFNPKMLETVFEKIGTPYKEAEFSERLALAKYWAEQCSPESLNHLLPYRNFEKFESLSSEEKKEIELLYSYLKAGNYTLDDLNTELYAIPGKVFEFADDKERKGAQGKFFKNVYELLIGKEKGPRLYLFLFAIESERYLPLLDFSSPETESEKAARAAAAEETLEQADAENDVEPIKEQITIDDFDKIDMRVCKVLKAEEVKKSHSCLKLTLFDGLSERVIMSSIKNEYTPEQLEGRKIIVIANLKPAKLAGVVSNGMLIAATHDSCGCKIIFVDDSVPEGTAIH
ncbi:MAG: lysine--tRNA ligase [Oscillospiraceae bacterium]|nr:lysine--tRNA ligase [Oscillospiraceae bacterium]